MARCTGTRDRAAKMIKLLKSKETVSVDGRKKIPDDKKESTEVVDKLINDNSSENIGNGTLTGKMSVNESAHIKTVHLQPRPEVTKTESRKLRSKEASQKPHRKNQNG